MERRKLLEMLLFSAAGSVFAPGMAWAKSNSGSGGAGGDNSGSGGGDDNDNDDNDNDNDDGDDDQNRDGDKDDDKDRDKIRDAVAKGEAAPLNRVLKVALGHTPGKVIDVKLRRRGKAYVYHIKILSRTSRKRELYIDAKSLRVLRVK